MRHRDAGATAHHAESSRSLELVARSCRHTPREPCLFSGVATRLCSMPHVGRGWPLGGGGHWSPSSRGVALALGVLGVMDGADAHAGAEASDAAEYAPPPQRMVSWRARLGAPNNDEEHRHCDLWKMENADGQVEGQQRWEETRTFLKVEWQHRWEETRTFLMTRGERPACSLSRSGLATPAARHPTPLDHEGHGRASSSTGDHASLRPSAALFAPNTARSSDLLNTMTRHDKRRSQRS